MLNLEQMNAIATVGGVIVQNLNFNAAKQKAKQVRIQARWKVIEGEFRKAELTDQAFQAAEAGANAARGKGFQGGDSVEAVVSKFAAADKLKRQVDLSVMAAVTAAQSQSANIIADAGAASLQTGLKIGVNAHSRNEQAKATSPLATAPKPENNSALAGKALTALTGG